MAARFIKLHWFERESANHLKYMGEMAICVDEITYIEGSKFTLKNAKLTEAETTLLTERNASGILSILHTKIFDIPEVIVVETVRDIYDMIR